MRRSFPLFVSGKTMKVKALHTFSGGYMVESFVFGGTRTKAQCDGNKKYSYDIISYLIDTGKDVILVDTSFPDTIISLPEDHDVGVSVGMRKQSFEETLHQAGYSLTDVTKIILTHHNMDHVGAISLFPNAEIYISEIDKKRLQNIEGLNVIGVSLIENPYKTFRASYEVAENIFMVQTYGHTAGHCAVVLYDEANERYIMFAGDVTSANQALEQKELMLPYENLELYKDTINRVYDFVKENHVIYLSTHDKESLQTIQSLS